MSAKNLEQIGRREYVSILMLSIGIKLADSTPSLIMAKTATSGWMVPFLGFIIIFPFFFLALRTLEKIGDIDVVDACYKVFGKYIGFLIGISLFLFLFTGLTVDMRNYVDTLATMYYPVTSIFILLLLFLAFCCFIATRGLSAIGSVVFITTLFVKFSLLIFGVLIMVNSNWVNMFPLFGKGALPLLKESVSKSSIYSDIFLLLVIYPYIKKEKLLKTTFLTTAFICLEVMFYIVAYMVLFGYPVVSEITYPFHEAARYIGFGHLASHVETYFMFFWLLTAILRFSFYLYGTALLMGSIFQVKEFKQVMVLLCINILILALSLGNPAISIMYIREYIFGATSILLMVFSVSFWGVYKLRGGKVSGKKL